MDHLPWVSYCSVSPTENTTSKVTDEALSLWSLCSITTKNDKYGWTREQTMTNSLIQRIMPYKAEAFLLNCNFIEIWNFSNRRNLLVCVCLIDLGYFKGVEWETKRQTPPSQGRAKVLTESCPFKKHNNSLVALVPKNLVNITNF